MRLGSTTGDDEREDLSASAEGDEMLQWMGGSRKKIKQTRNSLQARQKKFFEQRRHQQRDEVTIHNAIEDSRQLQRPESLDLLGLEKLCSVLAPLNVRKESPKAPGYTELCTDTCKEEMKSLETNAACRAEAEWIPASPTAAVAGLSYPIDEKNVNSSKEEQVAKQAPIQKHSPCKRGITLLDIVGDTEVAKDKSSSEAYAAFALEGTGILGNGTPARRQTASVDMLSRFKIHEHDFTRPNDGHKDLMDMNAVLGVQGSRGGEVPWHAPPKDMEVRCLSLESYDANEWHERFSLSAKQIDSVERRNAGRLDMKPEPDKADQWDASAEDMLATFAIDGRHSTRSKCGNVKDEPDFMEIPSMLGIQGREPAKNWQKTPKSYEANIWNELISQQTHAAAPKKDGWLDDGADKWIISPTAPAADMLCFGLDEAQSTWSNGDQLQDDLVLLPANQSYTAATKNEGWLHDKENHWNISPIAFTENMLISSEVDEAQSMCSKDRQLKDELGELISLPADQTYAAATRNENWPHDDEDQWNISPITSAGLLSFGVNEEQSTCSKGGHRKNEADLLDMHTVLGAQGLSCYARKRSPKFKEVGWKSAYEDNVWDDLNSPPATPSAGIRNETLRHGKGDEAVDLSSSSTTFAEDMLTSFDKDEGQTTILEGRHLNDESDMMDMNTFLGVEAELTWHHPAKEVPLQRALESYADVSHELFSVPAQAERRMLNVNGDVAEHKTSSKEQEQCGMNNVRDDNPQSGSSFQIEGMRKSTSPLFESPQGINQQRDRISKEENKNADCESCSGKAEIRPNLKNRHIQSVLLKLKKPRDCKERKQCSSSQHSTFPWSGDVQMQIQQLPGTEKDVLSTASCSGQRLQAMPQANEIGNPAFVNNQFNLCSQSNSSTGLDNHEPMVDEDSGNTKKRSPAVVKKPPENTREVAEHTGQASPLHKTYKASVRRADENLSYVRTLESYILQLQCINKALSLGQKE